MEMTDIITSANAKFNNILESRKANAKRLETRIDELKAKLANAPKDSRAYEVYSQQIRDTERNLRLANEKVEFMRPVDAKDMQARVKILKEFPRIVDSIFPDDLPIVFHGTNNIGTVREILKTGGLFTPEQRGVSLTSFAPAIDVTYKKNIRVSCEFAEAGPDSFLPYGAIFAFKPQEDEIERVLSTGDSTEVSQGVNGVNFVNEPKRLFGIITTPENIERVKDWCKQYSIDPNKVFTHTSFVEKYKHLTPTIQR